MIIICVLREYCPGCELVHATSTSSLCNYDGSKLSVVAAIDVPFDGWSNSMIDQDSQTRSEPEIVKQGSRFRYIA